MSEGFSPEGAAARRGRRDPDLARQMGGEVSVTGEDFLGEPGGAPGDADEPFLLPGDAIACKITHQVTTAGEPSWYSYGVQTRVADGESEQDAFIRAATIAGTRVLDLADDAGERLEAFREQRAETSRRIRPRF